MKEKITKTLLNLMRHQNYSKISVTTICENVPVSRTAFYHYFDNKDDIVFYFIEQDFLKNCFPIFKFHIKERGAQAFFSYLKEHKSFYTKLYHIDNGDFLFKCLKNAYHTGFDKRQEYTQPVLKKTPINPEVFAEYSCSALAAVVIYWIKNDMTIPEEVIAKELYLMMEEPLGIVRDHYL